MIKFCSKDLVFYHNDADGILSFLIYQKVGTPDASFPIDYDQMDLIPSYAEGGDTIWFLDFAPTPEVYEQIKKSFKHFIIIDHHATAQSYPYRKDDKVTWFYDSSKCGASLLWDFLFKDLDTPIIVDLIEENDIAQKATRGSYGASLVVETPCHKELIKDCLDNAADVQDLAMEEIIDIGEGLASCQIERTQNLFDEKGFEVTLDGYVFNALNHPRFGRLSQFLLRPDGHGVLSFSYGGEGKWTISLYSDTFNVSEIATRRGGGGHTRAAGYVVESMEELFFLPHSVCKKGL